MNEALSGQVALVTGASRGIGKAIAVALADAGADVAVNYRDRTRPPQATQAEIERSAAVPSRSLPTFRWRRKSRASSTQWNSNWAPFRSW